MTEELHTLGQVPPSACSMEFVSVGAGSSGADEHPIAANTHTDMTESTRVSATRPALFVRDVSSISEADAQD